MYSAHWMGSEDISWLAVGKIAPDSDWPGIYSPWGEALPALWGFGDHLIAYSALPESGRDHFLLRLLRDSDVSERLSVLVGGLSVRRVA